MFSEASSDQSCVRERADYNEVYLSGQDDPSTSYDEQVPSSNSPSTEEDEDMDMDGSMGDLNDEGIVSAEPPS